MASECCSKATRQQSPAQRFLPLPIGSIRWAMGHAIGRYHLTPAGAPLLGSGGELRYDGAAFFLS
ncbi:hypothetical protein CUC53_14490 [Aeromonas cavernicola]|uniref:Uncharacterized protein n=1 Tax=Aeromonas cavernicola TaxID=1006623 RepID=A0A2H9U230_9GAMM|nr:hypothetical protein CUC53_14490 [Aeromonas cavernicola]